MRKISGISIVLFFVLISTIQVGVTSCTKDHNIYDTVRITKTDTLVKKDTLIIKDTALTTQILTANAWKVLQINGVTGNSLEYYVRGGSNNVQSYDNEYIVFNANGTGLYVGQGLDQTAITWAFTKPDNTQLVWNGNFAVMGPLKVTYDNIRYKNNSLIFDQFYTTNAGVNSHSQVIRIPK